MPPSFSSDTPSSPLIPTPSDKNATNSKRALQTVSLPLLPLPYPRVLLPGIIARIPFIQHHENEQDQTMFFSDAANALVKDLFASKSTPSSSSSTALVPSPSPFLSSRSITTPTKIVFSSSRGDPAVFVAAVIPYHVLSSSNVPSQPIAIEESDYIEISPGVRVYKIAVIARVVSISRSGSGMRSFFENVNSNTGSTIENARSKSTYVVSLEGIMRANIGQVMQISPFLEGSISILPEPIIENDDAHVHALVVNMKSSIGELAELLGQLKIPNQTVTQLKSILNKTPIHHLAEMVVSIIDSTFEERLDVLSAHSDISRRLTRASEAFQRQLTILRLSKKIQTSVESDLQRQQREYILRQQMEAIKKELAQLNGGNAEGGGVGGKNAGGEEEDDLKVLETKLKGMNLPAEAEKVVARELKRLKRMNPAMTEAQVIRTYLEFIAELPWNTTSSEGFSDIQLHKAKSQLEHDHYGLEKVKKRILEYLSVRKLQAVNPVNQYSKVKGPILCFVGAPGLGKTSLGQSIAAAMNRKFLRIALGGVRDEAEIRGHRRTYVGALPGVILAGLAKCGTTDPVILLDEIDKLSRDWKGDPASALLEVLDPEQNFQFVDHYLGIPFDLSKIVFIATANDLETIPKPLLDRMEVIRLSGYTSDEKLEIAKRHLIPKSLASHGLSPTHVEITDKAILKLCTDYTREPGVRGLEREINALCRHVAVQIVDASIVGQTVIDESSLGDILGIGRFEEDSDEEDSEDRSGSEKRISDRTRVPGVVRGLAYTSYGGGVLYIESTVVPGGKGRLQLTGKLGDVIKESCQLAYTWVKVNQEILFDGNSLAKKLLESGDVHIHLPAGATPKDGPSAGVTVVTSLVSLFLGKAVLKDLAMTGEISLSGHVLPIGGVKEKVLAAHRRKIRTVILPAGNKRDVMQDVPEAVQKDIRFVYARDVWDVLSCAIPSISISSSISGGKGSMRSRL